MSSSESSAMKSTDGRQPIGLAAAALTLFTIALWGGTPVAIKYSVVVFPPIAVAAIRFTIAALFMLLWCRIEGSPLRLRPGQLRPALWLGLLLFLQMSLFHVGVFQSSSSHGTLFINTFVFWVAGIEHFMTRTSRLSPLRLAGLVIAAGGVVLILSTTGHSLSPQRGFSHTGSASDAPTLAGDLILLASGCVLGIKIIATKQAVKKVEPGKLIFWHDCVGVVLFTVYSTLFEDVSADLFGGLEKDEVLAALLGLLYQGAVVAGFCFAVQARLLRNHSAAQLSVFAFATPLFGITYAVLLRGDELSPWLFAAGLCVAVGILLVNSAPRGKSAAEMPASE